MGKVSAVAQRSWVKPSWRKEKVALGSEVAVAREAGTRAPMRPAADINPAARRIPERCVDISVPPWVGGSEAPERSLRPPGVLRPVVHRGIRADPELFQGLPGVAAQERQDRQHPAVVRRTRL